MNIPDVINIHNAFASNYDILVVAAIKDFDHLYKMDQIISNLQEVSIIKSATYNFQSQVFEYPKNPLFFKLKE